MPRAQDLIRVAPQFLGIPYSDIDCQAFVEKCLAEIGIHENLPGSNTWFRHMTWTGTPEECKASFGRIPPGAFLFILEHDGKEPEKFRADGIGNASHIGIYTGEKAVEMLSDCPKYQEMENTEEKKAFRKKTCFGNGAIHSSASRGCVCTSNFAGRTIDGGWNRVGLWDKLNYEIESEGTMMEKYQAIVIGGRLKLRTKPNTSSTVLVFIPDGSTVTVCEQYDETWSLVEYGNYIGYAQTAFLQKVSTGDMVPVPRSEIESIYNTVGKWLGR